MTDWVSTYTTAGAAVACSVVGDKALGGVRSIKAIGAQVIGLEHAHGVQLVQLQGSTVSVVTTVKDATAVASAAGADGTPLAVTAGTTGTDDVAVQVLEARTGRVLHQATVAHAAPTYASGAALPLRSMAASAAGSRTSTQPAYTLVLAYADGTLVCIDGARVAWVRHDGLATARNVLFEELPSAHVEGSSGQHAPPGLAGLWDADRMRLQWLALKSQLAMATPEEAAELARLRHSTSDKLLPYRCVVVLCTTTVLPLTQLYNH